MRKCSAFFLLIFIGASSFAQPDTSVNAKKVKPIPPWWVDRFSVSAGFFLPINNTSVKVGNEEGTFGKAIDFEEDLGFDPATITFLARLQWRASIRSKFELDYYFISRNSTTTIHEDIEFKDVIFPANSVVDASYRTTVLRVTYGYAFLVRPCFEAGVAIGAHIFDANIKMASSDGNSSTTTQSDFDFIAPLPDIGAWGGYAISNQWAVNGAFNYFSMAIDNIDGRILSYHAGITYRVLKNLSARLGYTGLNFKVNVTKERSRGDIRWGCNGPVLTINYSFGKNKWHHSTVT